MHSVSSATYEEGGSALDSVIKTLALLNRSIPSPCSVSGNWTDGSTYDEIRRVCTRCVRMTPKRARGTTGANRWAATRKA